MLEAIDLQAVEMFARIGGGAGLFVWATVWLLRRGDTLQRENISELRDQRDQYRQRAEHAEELVMRYQVRYGPLEPS